METIQANSIASISLEGFQVFKELTSIPFGSLTFLFGPNSAGKSAVQDALDVYSAMRSANFDQIIGEISRQVMSSDPSIQMSPAQAKDVFSRFPGDPNYFTSKLALDLAAHWRRRADGSNARSKEMRIGVVHKIGDWAGAMSEFFYLHRNGFSDRSDSSDQARWERSITCGNEFYSEFSLILRKESTAERVLYSPCYQLSVGDQLLIKRQGGELCVNLGHVLLNTWDHQINFSELAEQFPNEVSYCDEKITFLHGDFGGVQGFLVNGAGFKKLRENWLSRPVLVDIDVARASGWHHPSLIEALAKISLLVGSLLAALDSQLRYTEVRVDASRTVPKQRDLAFTLQGWKDEMHFAFGNEKLSYKILAESLASDLVAGVNPNIDANLHGTFARDVNRALTDHLFIEQGYRLDFDFRVLLSRANSMAALAKSELNINDLGFSVELHLRDASGRRHAFQDVGSGIGYVFPVLCALFLPIKTSCRFIQQPELHLHPALQAALGDVFIESARRGVQIIGETHSEHLLLRILKRIRQTSLKIHIAPELMIDANEVCVLYFSPGPDDSTTVKRLRISDEGEFMDRWPRGFFSERDQELFDE